jgi:hypothetical protein
MIEFSPSKQAFYDLTFDYEILPEDLIEIPHELHFELLEKINSGCIVFADLSCSEPRPTPYHQWNGSSWVDNRTAEEKEAERLKQFTPLTRYQFFRALLEHGYKSADIEARIQTIEDEYQRELVLLGWQSATNFVRTDESVLLMQNMLGWTDAQVEQMWTYAMNL